MVMRNAAENIVGAIVLALVFIIGSFFWLPGHLVELGRYALTGHASGEGLTTLPYILNGRDDLRGDFIMALFTLAIGAAEWGWLVRTLAVWAGW